VFSYPDADEVLIDAAAVAGAGGLVSAGTGAGFPTPAEHAALLRAVDAGMVVCQLYRGSVHHAGPRRNVQLVPSKNNPNETTPHSFLR
jgi:L-asparaginase